MGNGTLTEANDSEGRPWSAGAATLADVNGLLSRVSVLNTELCSVLDELAVLDDAVTDDPDVAPVLPLRRVAARACGTATSRVTHLGDRLAVRTARELLVCDGHLDDAVSTPARWLEAHLGIKRFEAQRYVRVARLLEKMTVLADGFAAGDIRVAHLDAIARIVPSRLPVDAQDAMWAALVGSQHELSAAATATPVRRFEQFCARTRDRLDTYSPNRSAEPSRMWLSQTLDGRWAFTGDLSSGDGAVLAAVIEEHTRKLLHAHNNDPGNDGQRAVMSELRAQAVIELCRDGAAATQPGRICLNVHIDRDSLGWPPEPDITQPGFTATTSAGTDITEDTLWAILADADVRPVFCTGGQPLSYGRTRRLAPDILKTILEFRDRHCAGPLCDTPPVWHDRHHLDHWENGGTTDPDNTTGICGFHHRGHHRNLFTIQPNPPEPPHVTRPDGTPIPTTPRWATHATRHHPYRQLVRQRLGLPPQPPPTPD